jgi:tRNA pseudouridine55 synthase
MRRGATGLCGIVGVDKPAGVTSHDVVDSVRRMFGERRCGHAGTLDPAATGLLLVAVGPATRLCDYLGDACKSYDARIVFGTATDTDDAEGEVIETLPVSPELLSEDEARRLLALFTGRLMQRPPAYSAIKRDGQRSYAAARAGHAMELDERPVTVYSAELRATGMCGDAPWWDVRFSVSKGTYIRALARDIGRAAGSCAHLSSLRRISIGEMSVRDACSLDELEGLPFEQACLDPVALLGLPSHELSAESARKVASGGKLSLRLGYGEPLVSLVHAHRLLALYERRETCYAPKVVITGGVGGVR